MALALGKTLWELFGDDSPTQISGAEYARWKRFYRRHPFGNVRGDMQAGIITRAIFAAHGAKRLPKLTDCVIVVQKQKPESPGFFKEQLRAVAMASGVPFVDGGQNGSRETGGGADG